MRKKSKIILLLICSVVAVAVMALLISAYTLKPILIPIDEKLTNVDNNKKVVVQTVTDDMISTSKYDLSKFLEVKYSYKNQLDEKLFNPETKDMEIKFTNGLFSNTYIVEFDYSNYSKIFTETDTGFRLNSIIRKENTTELFQILDDNKQEYEWYYDEKLNELLDQNSLNGKDILNIYGKVRSHIVLFDDCSWDTKKSKS